MNEPKQPRGGGNEGSEVEEWSDVMNGFQEFWRIEQPKEWTTEGTDRNDWN